MVTKVALHRVITVAGCVALGTMVFMKPHPVAFLLPAALFGFSMFIQYVERETG